MKFTANEQVRVFIEGLDCGVRAYWELQGFTSRLGAKAKPNAAWNMLLEIARARGEGIVTYKQPGSRNEKLRSRVRKLNTALTETFGLNENAVTSNNGRSNPAFCAEPPPLIRDFGQKAEVSEVCYDSSEKLDLLTGHGLTNRKRSRGHGPDR